MNRKIITVRGLSKSYIGNQGIVPVLRKIEFSVDESQMVAIIGESGSGKTTLLNLLGCLDQPTSGHISYESTDIIGLSNRTLAEFRNKYIGFVFQAFHLIHELSSIENVILPLRVAGLSGSEALNKAGDALHAVGLADKLWYKPSELSHGQMQRVAIARAIVNTPKLLLADEPTGNLDEKTAREIANLLKSLTMSKMAVIIATHSHTLAHECTKCYRLNQCTLEEVNL